MSVLDTVVAGGSLVTILVILAIVALLVWIVRR